MKTFLTISFAFFLQSAFAASGPIWTGTLGAPSLTQVTNAAKGVTNAALTKLSQNDAGSLTNLNVSYDRGSYSMSLSNGVFNASTTGGSNDNWGNVVPITLTDTNVGVLSRDALLVFRATGLGTSGFPTVNPSAVFFGFDGDGVFVMGNNGYPGSSGVPRFAFLTGTMPEIFDTVDILDNTGARSGSPELLISPTGYTHTGPAIHVMNQTGGSAVFSVDNQSGGIFGAGGIVLAGGITNYDSIQTNIFTPAKSDFNGMSVENGSVLASGFQLIGGYAQIYQSGINSYDGFTSANGGITVAGAVRGATFYGDASGLTNQPYVKTMTVTGGSVAFTKNADGSTNADITVTPGASALPAQTNLIWNLTNNANKFAGDGSGLTNLNAGNIASGTVAMARLLPVVSTNTIYTNDTPGKITVVGNTTFLATNGFGGSGSTADVLLTNAATRQVVSGPVTFTNATDVFLGQNRLQYLQVGNAATVSNIFDSFGGILTTNPVNNLSVYFQPWDSFLSITNPSIPAGYKWQDGALYSSGTITSGGGFIGIGTGLTGIPISGITGQSGVSYPINANNEIVRTNNSRDITSLQKPSGAILYSNGVNAGVISGASSIQLVVGFPNDTFVFSTNAAVVISGLANYTNGWTTSFSHIFTNSDSSAHTYTLQGFTSIWTNGVKCASSVITIPASDWMDAGGSVWRASGGWQGTNFYGLIQ